MSDPAVVRRPTYLLVPSAVNQMLPLGPRVIDTGFSLVGNVAVICPSMAMRKMVPAPKPLPIQTLPKGPVVSAYGCPGVANFVTTPPVVTRATLRSLSSDTQIFPSPPVVRPLAPSPIEYRASTEPSVASLINLPSAPKSVNQRLPSGPLRMSPGAAACVANVVAPPSGVMRPTKPPSEHVYQRFPSEPSAILEGHVQPAAYSVIAPVRGSNLPIRPLPRSVNQRLPFGPAAMSWSHAVETSIGPVYSLRSPTAAPAEGTATASATKAKRAGRSRRVGIMSSCGR